MSDLDRIVPPSQKVTLLDGREFTATPWPWPLARKLAPVIGRMFGRAKDNMDIEEVILASLDDGAELVKETFGITQLELENMAGEDVLSLVQAIFDLNVIRTAKDGTVGGMVGKFMALGGVNPGQMAAASLLQLLKKNRSQLKTSSPKSSPSSSEKVTPTPPSSDTPPTS